MTVNFDPFHRTFDSLESLADTISEVLGGPVTIEDSQHRLLAYSSHEQEVTDQARLGTIIGRRVPEQVIHSLWKSGATQALANSQEPIRVPAINVVGLKNRVAIAIHKDNTVLGYIWVIEAQPLTREHNEYLIQAARAARTKLLQLGARKQQEQEDQQEFFWRLLTGHIESHRSIRENAKRLKLSLPTNFCVVILEFEELITPKLQQQIEYVMSTSQQVRVELRVIDRRQCVALVGPYGPDELSHQGCVDFIQTGVHHLEERFGVSVSLGSSGNVYDKYEKVETSYQEAIMVLQLKRQFPLEMISVCSYHQLGFYRFLPIILQQEALGSHVNYSLQKLREYDSLHHTSLIDTLEVFIHYESNPRKAAEVLHVHLNTLNYRLQRICQIGEIDLGDIRQKLSLYLDLKIERLLQERHSL